MPPRQSNVSLLIGLIVSLILHVAVISPLLAAAMKPAESRINLESRFEPENFRRPLEEEAEEPPPEEDPLKLGIEDGSPSTLTWVGHREYEEHLARLAEVEQAAFTKDPAGGAPGSVPVRETRVSAPVDQPPVEAQPNQPALAEAEPIEEPRDEPPVDTPILQDEQAEQARDVQTPDEAEMLSEEPQVKPFLPAVEESDLTGLSNAAGSIGAADEEQPDEETTTPPGEAPTDKQRPEPPGIADMLEALRKLAEQVQQQQPQPSAQPQPQVQQQQPTPPQPPQPPAPDPSDSDEQGDQADKQSDATSIVDVPMDQIKVGKPVAALGLELKPVKPDPTPLQSLQGAPGDPLVEMHFTRSGRVLYAYIRESSGDTRIDEVIKSSLFGWRAWGKQLGELKGNETIIVQIRIMFGRR